MAGFPTSFALFTSASFGVISALSASALQLFLCSGFYSVAIAVFYWHTATIATSPLLMGLMISYFYDFVKINNREKSDKIKTRLNFQFSFFSFH